MAILEPTNLLLLACALIYGLIGEREEALILLGFVAAISLLDAWQQRRSQRALAELARLSSPRARVIRGGMTLELAPEQVQVGDVLRLDEGDRVAADAQLREGVGLWLDTSLLSGESLPVEVSRSGQLIRAGSLVASGRGLAAVVAVGEATELGRLGRSVASVTPPPTRLQRHTRRLTARLTVVALGLCAALAVLQGSWSGDWSTALLAALALALAVLPNEIPVVLALFLALGALRLARIGVLARWPAAVESLGSATVLAVDKTGTLTENRMAVQQLLSWPEAALWQAGAPLEEPWHRLLELALLASRHDPVDAMEQAIERLAQAELHHSEHLHPDWPLLREYPLSPDLLVFSQLWRDANGQWQVAAKGAPEAIAQLCHLNNERSAALLQAAEGLASRGLRVLAVASGLDGAPCHPELATGGEGPPATAEVPPETVHDYLFEPIGLVGLADPLRSDVPAAIALARGAGIRVVMITGDAPQTARAIADQAGLPAGPVLSGAELQDMEPGRGNDLGHVSVFARVLPQQKLQIVRALQAAGEVVAMTGDGVNDAPALKAADIGVAMGQRGTAVARESADLVLLGDDFGSLVQAIALGRRIEANLHKALGYTLAIHLPIAAVSLLPLLVPGQPLLLLPVHIALLHLVIDPACTVVFEAMPGSAGLMQQPPRPPEAPLFGPATWRRALLQGGVMAVLALVIACWPDLPAIERRSLLFTLLLLGGGVLVWLNGEPRSRISQLGGAIGLGLWLLLQLIPGLNALLLLRPLQELTPWVLLIAVVIVLSISTLTLPKPASAAAARSR
ncbi:HAD-IC family P-type ATPase [Cyanobium sp. FGCU-6]|nr:HAD-IC family P-type ATPase [Cyanobium sp. FGCU6]